MSELKYDSLYSALKALNVALGGNEINDADSTYTVIERLSETLGFSEQTPMLLSVGGGSECPTTSIEIGANGEYNIDENTGFVGWNQVNVNIPNFVVPETQLVSYTETVNFGDPFEFIFKCKMPDGAGSVELNIENSMGMWWDFDVTNIETSGEWITAKYISSQGMTKSDYVKVTSLNIHYNNGVYVNIPVSYNMNFTCNGAGVDLPETEWVEGTWGDPNQAIVCANIADFLTKPDSTKENPQWYEFNCRVLTAPLVEDLRMVVDDDSISETAANNPLLNNKEGKIGIVINQSNNILTNCGPMCTGSDWSDIFPGDNKWCKIRTLKFTADKNYIINSGNIIVKQGTVIGGKFGDSPCAIIVEKYETKP